LGSSFFLGERRRKEEDGGWGALIIMMLMLMLTMMVGEFLGEKGTEKRLVAGSSRDFRSLSLLSLTHSHILA
jgi:hypothetical protein